MCCDAPFRQPCCDAARPAVPQFRPGSVARGGRRHYAKGVKLRADNWPGWRGPRGTGVSAESGFPVTWDASNIQWKTPIPGRGHSSPIVWRDRVFLTTSIEGDVVPGKEAKPVHKLGTEDFIHPDMVSHDRRQTMKVKLRVGDAGD